MRAGVTFAARVVVVIGSKRRDAVGPFGDVLQESRLFIIDEESRIRMQRGDEDDAVADAAFLHGRLYVWREIQELTLLLGLHGYVIAMNAHWVSPMGGGDSSRCASGKKFAG